VACNVIAVQESDLRTLYLNGGAGTEDEGISGGRVERRELPPKSSKKQHVAVGLCRMKSARIRGVLFDFGGTLLDYREEVFGA